MSDNEEKYDTEVQATKIESPQEFGKFVHWMRDIQEAVFRCLDGEGSGRFVLGVADRTVHVDVYESNEQQQAVSDMFFKAAMRAANTPDAAVVKERVHVLSEDDQAMLEKFRETVLETCSLLRDHGKDELANQLGFRAGFTIGVINRDHQQRPEQTGGE